MSQGCALAEPGGIGRLIFALGWLENLSFFIQIICWAPKISQVQSTGLPSIFLRAEPCVLFFSSSHAVLSAILRDEYLTAAVGTKEGDKAGSNQPPVRDPVQFKLELTPNYLISYLENTGSRSTRYVSMLHRMRAQILPKFLKKSDPEVARPPFSTWPVQKSQPKAFEVCVSIQIHQSAYRNQTNIPVRGSVVVLNCQWLLIGGFESTRIPQMPLVEIFAPVMLNSAFWNKL